MSNDQVYLAISHETYRKIESITVQLNAGEVLSLSKPLGEALTTMTCEVLEQAFGVLVKKYAQYEHLASQIQETEKVLQQIDQYLQKYMPWSISLFGNDRLKPVANHILQHFDVSNPDQVYLCYAVAPQVVTQIEHAIMTIEQGDISFVPQAFKALIEVVDTGVTELIRKPKSMLKFNFVVDKTLNGVIHMVTNLGYKRIEKMGQHLSVESAQIYTAHFNGFIRHS